MKGLQGTIIKGTWTINNKGVWKQRREEWRAAVVGRSGKKRQKTVFEQQ